MMTIDLPTVDDLGIDVDGGDGQPPETETA